MRGYVAVTDPGWWKQLSRTAGPKDANFWRPSSRRVRLETGTPFFFKLKAPHRKIAGFGYFAGFSVLPVWLAWETFGEANGVTDVDALRARLGRIREGARIQHRGETIGCCLIAEATFFEESDWVDPPSTWSPRTQSGAGIDLTEGEGLHIWTECLSRAASRKKPQVAEDAPRYGEPTVHRPRLGQSIFRIRVLDAYDRACAVTTEHSLPVLDAAHIRPYSEGGDHSMTNGLSLRTDLHRLFDRGYVTVDEEGSFVVGKRLREDYENGRSYYALHGSPIALPADPRLRPDPKLLAWHREQRFLG